MIVLEFGNVGLLLASFVGFDDPPMCGAGLNDAQFQGGVGLAPPQPSFPI